MDPQQPPIDGEKSFIARNFIALAIIATLLLIGIGFLLYQLKFLAPFPPGPAIPPIIIRSVEGESPSIEIETPSGLVETESLVPSGNSLVETESLVPSGNSAERRKLYQYEAGNRIKYVRIDRSSSSTSSSNEYRSESGLKVKIWLQYQDDNNKQWYYEPGGQQFEVDGTQKFRLTCEKLSPEKPINEHKDNERKSKRSFNGGIKSWRIGRVKVGNEDPIEINNYTTMVITFDDHYPSP